MKKKGVSMSKWERHGQSKKKKTKQKVDLIVDTREPESMHHQLEIFKTPFKIRTLTFGDYEFRNAVAERKTIFDFVASFRSGRIFEQLEGLARTDCIPVLLICGSLGTLKKDPHFAYVNEETVIGALASCICRYGVHTFWVHDDTDCARVITQFLSVLGKCKVPEDKPFSVVALQGYKVKKKSKLSDKDIADKLKMVVREGGCLFWGYDDLINLRVLERLYKKIGEGKFGTPRRQLVKRETGSRTADLVRNFLRVEPTLAKMLVACARRKGVGVMRYILEAPNSELLGLPGVGNVTLKRIRELVG